jgi:hypothetical protein
MPPTKNFLASPSQMIDARLQLGLPDGNTGQFNPPSHPEVTLGYSYDGVGILTLTILHEGFFEIAPMVWAAIGKYLVEAPEN